MAQAKKKNKKKTARKNTTKKKKKQQQTDWLHSEVFRVCLFLCLIALCIISVFKFGIVGSLLFYLFSFIMGNFTYAFLIFILCICAIKCFNPEEKIGRKRYWIGLIFFSLAWILLQSVLEFKPHEADYGLSYIIVHASDILHGEYQTLGGITGAGLLCLICSLVDYIGCYLCIALFVLIGIMLFWYEIIQTIAYEKQKALKDATLQKKDEFIQSRQQRKVQKQARKEQYTVPVYDSNETIFMDYDPRKESGYSEVKQSPFITLEDVPVKKKKTRKKENPFEDENEVPTFKIKQGGGSTFDIVDANETKVEEKPKRTRRTRKVVEKTIEEIPSNQPVEEEVPKTYVVSGDESFADYRIPTQRDIANMLEKTTRQTRSSANRDNATDQGQALIEILAQFGVPAKLVDIHIGPSVTKFEIKPEMGIRVSKISNLQNDIKMALAATDIRIEAPIPGKNAVGIEIPNLEKTTVQMKDLVDRIPENKKDNPLLFVLGKDLGGESIYGEMNKMPHLLIAGATGSGKSVCVNSIICSILLRTRPDQVKLVLVDPKKVEFTPYNDVPHLLAPVITDADMANKALKVVVEMMDKRYDLFGELGVRNITAYNKYLSEHPDEAMHLKPLPYLVVIIDELADLMLVAAKDVEASIQRITQLARAAGIHLIVATQRPSVDVITGVIKANIPSRIAFAVSSAVDSRTILDQIGAERLLGYGDMLYLPNGETAPKRVQGVFIKDEEVNEIAGYVKAQAKPHYDDAFITLKDIASQGGEVASDPGDPLYDEVKRFVIQSRRASTSLIQRKFSVGYSRAARLMDVLEENGIIGPANGSKPREILVQNTLEEEYE